MVFIAVLIFNLILIGGMAAALYIVYKRTGEHRLNLIRAYVKVLRGNFRKHLWFLDSAGTVTGEYKGSKVKLIVQPPFTDVTIRSDRFPKVKWFYLSGEDIPQTESGYHLTNLGLTARILKNDYPQFCDEQHVRAWLDGAINEGVKIKES